MARVDSLGHFLTDVADAIRTKGGTSEPIQASSFDTAIANIPSGGGGSVKPTSISYYKSTEQTLDFTDIPLDTSSITGFSNLFRQCNNLVSLNIADLDFSKIIYNNDYMISENSSLTNLTLGNFDCSSLTNASNMFRTVNGSLTNVSVTSFDLSSATNLSHMFNSCASPQLITALMNVIYAPNTTNLSGTFYNCYQLTNLDLSHLVISPTTLTSTFGGCSGLTSLDLSSFSGAPTNVKEMFSGCVNLTHLDVRNLVFSGITSSSNYQNMCGGSWNTYMKTDCEIIVKDGTEKAWFATNFPRQTNVKTVAEYEAE